MEPSKARKRPTILIISAIILMVCFPMCYWAERAFGGNSPCPALIFSRGTEPHPLAFNFDDIEALYSLDFAGPVGDLALSPDGSWIALSAETSIAVYDLPTGKLINTLSAESPFVRLVWSIDGSLLAGVVSTYAKPAEIGDIPLPWEESVAVWDRQATGQVFYQKASENFLGYYKSVNDISFSPDNRTLIVTAGGDVAVWDIQSGDQKCLSTTLWEDTHTDHISHIVVWPSDGPPLSAKFMTGRGIPLNNVSVWNLATGWPVLTIDPGQDLFYYASWSPGGKYIALRSSGVAYGKSLYRVTVWDAHSGDLALELDEQYTIGAWSPDGRYLLVWSENEVVVWDVPAGEQHLIPISNVDSITDIDWAAQYLVIQTDQRVETYAIGIR